MKRLSFAFSPIFSLLVSFGLQAEGPDVMLGVLDVPLTFEVANDTYYLGAATTSCNAGDADLLWLAAPNNRHPVIALNLYKVEDEKFTQLGQSWLKHGFFALQQNICGFGCQASASNALGPGCSDPYGARMNSGPDLGARSEVNPVTVDFNGAAANDHTGHVHPIGKEHSLTVDASAITNLDATYIIEGHYLAADDAAAGNAFNNVSHRLLKVVQTNTGQFAFVAAGDTIWYEPAILAQTSAKIQNWDTIEAEVDGVDFGARVVASSNVIRLDNGMYRYHYTVYNMNSDRGIGKLEINTNGNALSNIEFDAVESKGEIYSNASWDTETTGNSIAWKTQEFGTDENANAIRWGTAYTFSFDSNSSPSEGNVTIHKFKPGLGASQKTFTLHIPN